MPTSHFDFVNLLVAESLAERVHCRANMECGKIERGEDPVITLSILGLCVTFILHISAPHNQFNGHSHQITWHARRS